METCINCYMSPQKGQQKGSFGAVSWGSPFRLHVRTFSTSLVPGWKCEYKQWRLHCPQVSLHRVWSGQVEKCEWKSKNSKTMRKDRERSCGSSSSSQVGVAKKGWPITLPTTATSDSTLFTVGLRDANSPIRAWNLAICFAKDNCFRYARHISSYFGKHPAKVAITVLAAESAKSL